MRLVVEVVSGLRAGHKFWMCANQSCEVGNTEWADFNVEGDPHMRPIHFAVQTDHGTCWIRDPHRNGTRLNGRCVEEAELADGDTVQAGTTTFRVRIEGAAVQPAKRALATPIASELPGKAKLVVAVPPVADVRRVPALPKLSFVRRG